MAYYWLVVLTAPLFLGGILFLGTWLLAHSNIIFGFIKEGRGAFVMSGESFERPLISFHGHRIERTTKGGKTFLEIVPGEPVSEGIILDWLRKEFGIYYFGPYPFKRRLLYKFRWNEWSEKSVDGKLVEELARREEETDFFYAQTFPYALVLEAAETGGTKTEDGIGEVAGNLSVDLSIVLLVKIVRPQVAILQTENWFDSLGATVIHQARMYVGSHTFDQLRSQEHKEEATTSGSDVFVHDEFCEHIMKLNVHAPIGDNEDDSIIDAYGVKIIGAQILRIDIAGDKDGSLVKATTEAYRKQQEAIGMREIADAEAYKIEKTGDANAKAIRAAGDAHAHATKAEAEAVRSMGEDGRFVKHQNTIGEAGKGGNTVIFTRNNDDELLSKLIVPQQLQKGVSNGSNSKKAA